MTLAQNFTKLGPSVVAVVAVGLVPAATTAGTPHGRTTEALQATATAVPSWVDPLAPAGKPGYHVLNGVDELSADDVLAVGVGGPPGGQARAWQWDGKSWSSTHPQCDNSCGLAAIARINRSDAWQGVGKVRLMAG